MGRQTSIASKTLHLESHKLDREFESVIDHAVDSIQLQSVSEEIKVLLKFYITSLLLKNGETIGSKIYRLKLADGGSLEPLSKPISNNVLLFTTLNIVFPYLTRRKETIRTHLPKVLRNHEASWLDADNLISLFKAMSVINFFVFLFQGKYLSIVERISRIVPVISDKDYYSSMAINRVQMDLLNREIIWRELASFLTTVIPYIRTEKIQHKLMQVLCKFGLGPRQKNLGLADHIVHQVDLHRCGICESQPFNPYTIGCKHIFCYYCLESRHLLDPEAGYSCTKCNYVTKDTSESQRHRVYQTRPSLRSASPE